jgi:hypothetical protein
MLYHHSICNYISVANIGQFLKLPNHNAGTGLDFINPRPFPGYFL